MNTPNVTFELTLNSCARARNLGFSMLAVLLVTILARAQSESIGYVDLRFSILPANATLNHLREDLDGKGVLITPEGKKVQFQIASFTAGDSSLRGKLHETLIVEPAEMSRWLIRLSGKKYLFCTNSQIQRIYGDGYALAAATFEVNTAWRPFIEADPEPQIIFAIHSDCSVSNLTNRLDVPIPLPDSESVRLEMFHELTGGQWVLPLEIKFPQGIGREGKQYRGNFNAVRFLGGRQSPTEKNFVKSLLEDTNRTIRVYDFNKRQN